MEHSRSADDPSPVFNCRMCGLCCLGKGGIVVGPRDLPRLCAYLNMDEDEFVAAYTYVGSGKLKIRSGSDDYCIFFVADSGCSVHPAKPDICRAWPFFRGNLVDQESLTMAREFCPGIASGITHADFVREGLRYLQQHNLCASDPEKEACALLRIPS